MNKRKVKLLLLLLALVAVVAGIIWYQSSLTGEFDISGSMPDQEMLLHIVKNAHELPERDERFIRNSEDPDDPSFVFFGRDYMLQVTCGEGAIEELSDPNAKPRMPAKGTFARQPNPGFWDYPTPWSKCNVTIGVIYEHFSFVLMGYDLQEPSTEQLDRIMSNIELLIGTP